MFIGRIEKDIDGFKTKVSESNSFAELGRKLDYKPSGGIHKFLKQKIKEHHLDVSHFTGHGWAKGKTRESDASVNKFACGIERPWEEVFIKGSVVKNSHLLRRLVTAGKRRYCCYRCGMKKWNNKPLRLQLDHKNGDNIDNREKNLRLVCPNCHTQTPTYSRGTRNKSKQKHVHVWWERLSMG